MKNRYLTVAAIAAFSFLTPFALRAEDAPKPKGGKAAAAFAAADKDSDGKLNVDEFVAFSSARLEAAAAKARFAELDADKDGFVTREELRAGMKGQGGGKKAEKSEKE